MTLRVIEHVYQDPCRSIVVFSKSEVAVEHVTKDQAYGPQRTSGGTRRTCSAQTELNVTSQQRRKSGV